MADNAPIPARVPAPAPASMAAPASVPVPTPASTPVFAPTSTPAPAAAPAKTKQPRKDWGPRTRVQLPHRQRADTTATPQDLIDDSSATSSSDANNGAPTPAPSPLLHFADTDNNNDATSLSLWMQLLGFSSIDTEPDEPRTNEEAMASLHAAE
jgi:hypothetical protein